MNVTKSQYSTLHIHQDESRMTRTLEVRNRIGPIVSRMKSSLTKIQQLQESLGCQTQKKDLVAVKMRAIKTKMQTLHSLEESLDEVESRKQELRHCYLRTSVSKKEDLDKVREERDSFKNDLDSAKCQLGDKISRCERLESAVNDLTVTCETLREKVSQLESKGNANNLRRSINSIEEDDTDATASESTDSGYQNCSPPQSDAGEESINLSFETTSQTPFEDCQGPLIAQLMAKIEALDSQNEELLRNRQQDQMKIRALEEENKAQAARIAGFEGKNEGSLFKKLLQADNAQQLKSVLGGTHS